MKKLLSILLTVLMVTTLGAINVTAEGETDDVKVFEIPVTYTVRENTAPKIIGADDVTIVKGSVFNPLDGVSVVDPDEEDKDLTIDVGPTINTSNVGVYEVHYQVQDNECEIDHVVRKVTVVDSNASVGDNSPVESASVRIDDVVSLISEITTDNSTLTQQQIEDINNGTSSAVIGLLISESGASSDEKSAVTDKVEKELSVNNSNQILFLDVQLQCEIKDSNGTTIDTKNITNANQEVTVSVQVPEEFINKDDNVTRTYSIVRLHDGTITILDADYDPSTNMLTFKTDRFSLYAIVYKDTKAESGNTYIPSKPSNKKPVVNTDGSTVSINALNLRPKEKNGSFELRLGTDDLAGKAAFMTISDTTLTSEKGDTVTLETTYQEKAITKEGAYEVGFNVVDENKKPGVYTGTLTITLTFKSGVAAVGNNIYQDLQEAVDNANESNVEILKDISLSNALEINKSVTINGNNHSVECQNGETDRAININDNTDDISLVINNLKVVGPTTGTYTRGISAYNNTGKIYIELNECEVSANYYAINIAGDNADAEVVANKSTITGWCAAQSWSSNAKFTFDGCNLIGNNDKGYNADGWNDFATIVINDGTTENEFTFNNCNIEANQTTGNNQYFMSIRDTQNKVSLNNCLYKVNGIEVSSSEMFENLMKTDDEYEDIYNDYISIYGGTVVEIYVDGQLVNLEVE